MSIQSEPAKIEENKAKELLRQSYGLVQALAVLGFLIVIMAIITPRFLSWINITNLMAQMAPMLIVACGMTIVMIGGEFDLSVGSVVALTASAAAVLMKNFGILPAVCLALLIGPVLSLFNALIVIKGKVPSFIATLGMLMMARSLAFVCTGGKVIANLPEQFKVLGQGYTIGIPNPFLIALSCYLVGWFLMNRTVLGKKIYAVGANRTAAMLSGIQPARIKLFALIIVGFTASLAGIVLLSRIGAIQADTARGLEFEVIAAVVIGGTSLYGGQGNILRTIIGVFIIAIVRNFLNLSHINIFWQDFTTGAIIIGAVLFDILQKRIGSRQEKTTKPVTS